MISSSVRRITLAISEARQVCDVPTAAERLNQQDASVHPTQQDVDGVQFVGQCKGLGGDDLQVRVYPPLVPIRGQLQEFLRGGDGASLLFRFLHEHAESSKVVLHLLEGGQCGLAIGGNCSVVVGDGRVRGGAAPSRIKERLR